MFLGFAYLPGGITIRKDEKCFVILDQDTEIAQIKDRVRLHILDEEIEDYSDWKFGIMMNASSSLPPMENSKFALYKENFKHPSLFEPPIFGVTVLGSSHGFDPKGNTSGYLVWINGRLLFCFEGKRDRLVKFKGNNGRPSAFFHPHPEEKRDHTKRHRLDNYHSLPR